MEPLLTGQQREGEWGWTNSSVQERGQRRVSSQRPKTAPFPALTYFCLSASFLCSEVSVLGLPSRPGSGGSAAGDLPSLRSAGGHSHTAAEGTAAVARGHVLALGHTLHSRDAQRRHTGSRAPAPLPQPGGTFGALELRVLLPGPAEILQGRRLGLEALELLQPILQAPGSLQHRSGVCGMCDGR